jgi:hypothetical protein
MAAMRSIGPLAIVALAANTLFEIGAGILILVSPLSVFPGAGPQAAAIARTLAAAAIAAGTLSLLLLLTRDNSRSFRAAFLALGVFHVVLAVAHGASAAHGFTALSAPVGHGLVALLFGLALVGKRRPAAKL